MPMRLRHLIVLLVMSAMLSEPACAETSALDPRLEAAVDLYRQEGAEQALPEFERLAREFAGDGNHSQHAAALHYVGESHWRLGQFDEARTYLERALRLERRAGDRHAEGKTLNVIGLLEWDLGNYEQATRSFRDAGAIGRAVGDPRLEGASLNNLGLVQDELGEYDASLANYRKALDLYRVADFPRGVGDTLGNIGGVHLLLGRFREALDYYEQALAISEQLESGPSMSQDHGNIGLCLLGLGEADAALTHFDQAIALAAHAGMRQDEAYWTRHKGSGLIQQGRYDQGLEAYRRALATYEQIEAQAELLEGLHDAGRLYLLLGDVPSAERYFTRAMELARSIGLARGVTQNLLALGDLEFRRKRLDAAAALYGQARQRASEAEERHLLTESLLRVALVHREQAQLPAAADEVRQGLVIAREIGARPLEAEALMASADLDRRRGRLGVALEGFGTAQAVAVKVGDPDLLWQVHFGRGLALEASGDPEGAIKALLEAVTVIEGVRSRLLEPRYRAGYVEDKYDVYLELVRLQLKLGRKAEAFSTAERLRARHYAEQLGGRTPQPLSTEDRRREVALRGRIRQLQGALSSEENQEQPSLRQHVSSRLHQELVAAEREYQAFLDDRSQADPPTTALHAVPTAAAVQKRLAGDEALLEYVVAPQHLTVFVVTARGIEAITTLLRRADLNAQVALLRDLIRRPGDERWMKPAARLSAGLLGPLEADGHLDGVRRLYIVPHGVLNQLPFSLLADDDREADRLFVDRYTVTYLPTAATLLTERATGSGARTLLAVAPARSRLRHAPEEARAVHAMFQPQAQLLLGRNATESQFKKVAGRYRMLHLATHGDFNAASPLLSGLEFEADESDDGLLQIHEILGLQLEADLVTLSACETGLAGGYFSDVPTGDELVGMTRAFLTAGTSSVMATLWEVDDRASVKLMQRFYERLTESGGIGNAASALARTQRDMRATKELGHPYYWAPFILAGTTNPTPGRTAVSIGRAP